MDDFQIVPLQPEDIGELLEYNRENFNHDNEEEFYRHRFVKNPSIQNERNYIYVVKGYEGKIIGQIMFLPMSFYNKGKVHCGGWGSDMRLDKEVRGKGIGIKLAIESKKVPNMFVLGVTSASLGIFKKEGYHILDELDRLIYIPSVFSYISLFFRSKKRNINGFPEYIKQDGIEFKLQTHAPNIENYCWNQNIIEFVRDTEYFKWRFFDVGTKFSFYYNEDELNPIYFVVKEMSWRNKKFIVLVDMRCSIKESKTIDAILKACKQILARAKAKGIISGSSLKCLHDVFYSNGFMKFEKPTIILTSSDHGDNYPYLKKTGSFVTMADSDLEYVYNLKGNLHKRIFKAYLKK